MSGTEMVIESGGTKSNWCFPYKGEIQKQRFPGLHPTVQTSAEMLALLKAIKPQLSVDFKKVKKIYFYGAGCSHPTANAKVEAVLKSHFPYAQIAVSHDLHAAAIALFGAKKGIACILGTGSSAAYYDGKSLTSKTLSLGYVLGDEGSGADIGKKIIQDWAYHKVPEDLTILLQKQMPEMPEIIERVYQAPNPNRYLAGFAKLLSPHQNHPYVKSLIMEAFEPFFKNHVLPYQQGETLPPVGFVGSIAFYYANLLTQTFQKCGLKQENLTILQEPTRQLLEHHFPNNKDAYLISD